MRTLAAVPLAVLLVLVGAWTALCAVVFSSLDWGLLLGVLASVTTSYALPGGWPRLGFTAGWVGVLVVTLLERPEGDWVIVADWHGYSLLATGVLLLAYGVATVPRRARKPEIESSPT